MPGKPIVPKKPLIKGKPKLVVDPKPIKGKPYPMPSIDDDIVRTMPITSKQLGQIKKRYGI